MSSALFRRLLRKRVKLTTKVPPRTSVCPPSIFPARASAWVSMRRWLARKPGDVAPALRTPLERARCEFVTAMHGLLDIDDNDLLRRAQHARSLRELWHLRSELYTMIARRVSQQEADARLARLNRYFPMRAQRTAHSAAKVVEVH